jgi:hypothetical protein
LDANHYPKEANMRGISLLVVGIAAASCAASAQQPARTAKSETTYQRLLAGKVARAPISCLPTRKANDMVVIDENTIAFKDGSSRVYINHPQGACNQLGQGHTALVSKQFGQNGPCRGDVAQVVDTLSGMTLGSCALGDFTPYVRQAG